MNTSKRTPIREQDPKIRCHNFSEVCLGYTEDEAVQEASRCLHCKNPLCMEGCPVSISIPDFIQSVKEKNFTRAYQVLSEATCLPSVCGRVCPQETQCEGRCVLGVKGDAIAIGKLERFVGDYHRTHDAPSPIATAPKKHKKIGIIGTGPSGLSAAGELLKRGYDVTLYEALHVAGGVLCYGIPEFRLPKDIVRAEIDDLKKRGAEIRLNTIIGKTLSFDELFTKEKCDKIFIGTGAGLPRFMHIPGENGNQVFSANEFLVRTNLMEGYLPESDTFLPDLKKVFVVGGGNVAMDAARTALRFGAETHIVYRRSLSELPARREEVEHAREEGVQLDLLQNPVRILLDGQGNVTGLTLIKMELGEPDASGRRSPVEIPGSEYDVSCDGVIIAIGTVPNPVLSSAIPGVEVQRGKIVAESLTGRTSRENVYAGGDIVTGAATVILAMQAGKEAAVDMDLSENG